MASSKQTARLAGVLYAVTGFAGAFSLTVIPKIFVVPGDAAATAANIASSPLLYRLGIVSDLLNQVAFVLLALVLHHLFEEVDRRLSVLMVSLVLVQVAATFAILLLQVAPLVLLSGAPYLSVFDRPQLEALALAALNLRGRAIAALGTYMGLWLLPFGALVYRCGFMPRILGALLQVAGWAYVVSTVAYFLVPAALPAASVAMMAAAAAGEGAIVLWLLIKGVREEPAAPSAGALG